MSTQQLRVNEIFTSLSGEPDGFGSQGVLATFIRLQGCNLCCSWCDTVRAQDGGGGELYSIDSIVEECTTQHIVITGGEPLLQNLNNLVGKLISTGHRVTIETNGSQYLPTVNQLCSVYQNRGTLPQWRESPMRFVVDYKPLSSKMSRHMKPEVFTSLSCFDVIKFVVADLVDYRYAVDLIAANSQWLARLVISPVMDKDHPEWPSAVAQQIVRDHLEDVRFSLQLHKLICLR